MIENDSLIIETYLAHLKNKAFSCIAAKAALAKDHIKCMVAHHLACPDSDKGILNFLYDFVEEYRDSKEFYHSAAIIFRGPENMNEEMFDALLWKRLQALADLDAANFGYDKRVSHDPSATDFSFSIKEEAFYIIGLHSNSSRPTRRFMYPTLVFNPHAQFEQLRNVDKYESMKTVIRKREIAYAGSINPMLKDFGELSEVHQYSGRKYEAGWQCPLKINHAAIEDNSAA